MIEPRFHVEPRPQDAYAYGAAFYRANARVAARSAERLIPKLIAAFPVRSVVDFGCGRGAWLSVWANEGAAVIGVDGPSVDRRQLLIDPACFRSADLAGPIDIGRQFDLVQSLEVAEHLPPASAERIVGTLTAHGPSSYYSPLRSRGREASIILTNSPSNTGEPCSGGADTSRSISLGPKSSTTRRSSDGTDIIFYFTSGRTGSRPCRNRCNRVVCRKSRRCATIGLCPTSC